jgi:hypothetical protein
MVARYSRWRAREGVQGHLPIDARELPVARGDRNAPVTRDASHSRALGFGPARGSRGSVLGHATCPNGEDRPSSGHRDRLGSVVASPAQRPKGHGHPATSEGGPSRVGYNGSTEDGWLDRRQPIVRVEVVRAVPAVEVTPIPVEPFVGRLDTFDVPHHVGRSRVNPLSAGFADVDDAIVVGHLSSRQAADMTAKERLYHRQSSAWVTTAGDGSTAPLRTLRREVTGADGPAEHLGNPYVWDGLGAMRMP